MVINDFIKEFNPYILNNENIETYLKYNKNRGNDNSNSNYENSDVKYNGNSNKNITSKENRNSLFIPKEYDTLFWCYYIIKNGDYSYETLNNKNVLTTKQLKIEYVSKIRENKPIIKTYKFDTISNLESNLANDDVINMKTILTLCAIDNINIVFITKHTYFELLMNDGEDIYVIRELNSKYKKKYGFEILNSKSMEEIRNTLYKMETIDKPIKGLSAYKVQELKDIATKLAIETTNLDTGKCKTKNELYEAIIKYF